VRVVVRGATLATVRAQLSLSFTLQRKLIPRVVSPLGRRGEVVRFGLIVLVELNVEIPFR